MLDILILYQIFNQYRPLSYQWIVHAHNIFQKDSLIIVLFLIICKTNICESFGLLMSSVLQLRPFYLCEILLGISTQLMPSASRTSTVEEDFTVTQPIDKNTVFHKKVFARNKYAENSFKQFSFHIFACKEFSQCISITLTKFYTSENIYKHLLRLGHRIFCFLR